MRSASGFAAQAASRRSRLTVPTGKYSGRNLGLQKVLILKYAGGLYSLRRGTFAEGWAVRRPSESAVQMFEVRKDHHRGDQTARGFDGGHVAASFVCQGQRLQFEPEPAAARSGNPAARKCEGGAQHSVRPI